METLKILTFVLCIRTLISAPISVPVDNNYQYNPPSYSSHQDYYDDTSARKPNSYFNRLPPNSNLLQDGSADYSSSDDDYDDQQTDKPVPPSSSNFHYQQQNQQQQNQQSPQNHQTQPSVILNNNFLLSENHVKKKKKKRRVRRPCIPIQSFGAPVFSNRIRRQAGDQGDGKTLALYGLYHALGGGFPNYGGYYAPNYQSDYNDNVKPQYESTNSKPIFDSNSQYDYQQPGQVQYQSYGGYPCVPVSYGHKPGGGGLFGNRPSGGGLFGNRPLGGGGLLDGVLGGGSTGPLGFFGEGGLLDFGGGSNGGLGGLGLGSIGSGLGGIGTGLGSLGGLGGIGSGLPGPLAPAGVYQGTGNYPQTVIINRPPLFGNLPNYNRPQSGEQSDVNGQGPGFWGTVLDKLSEFVSNFLSFVIKDKMKTSQKTRKLQ